MVREGCLQSQIGFGPVPSPLHSETITLAILIHFSIVHVQSGVWPMTV